MSIKTSKFIKRANEIHKNRYDYTLVDYINAKTSIKIICNIHGVFEQRPDSHINGHNCKMCSIDSNRVGINELIERANEIHNNKYNYEYSFSGYENIKSKIDIICDVHGMFEQTMDNHLQGKGCKLCGVERMKIGKRKGNLRFINDSIKVHNNKYNYELVKYNASTEVVDIICNIHGLFKQLPTVHLSGCGCPKCGYDSLTSNGETFIMNANKIHNNKYNYSLTNYKNSKEKVEIICNIHGIFKQSPNSHISGGNGCPSCRISKGEERIERFLENNNIIYYREKQFNRCVYVGRLRFDFHIPKYNLCIEYDGIQHFKAIDYFGGSNGLEKCKKRDDIKNKYCLNNNIKLLRIAYLDYDIIDEILTKFLI